MALTNVTIAYEPVVSFSDGTTPFDSYWVAGHSPIVFKFNADPALQLLNGYKVQVQVKVGIRSGHTASPEDPLETVITLSQTPDSNGQVIFDIQEYVQTKLNTRNDNDQPYWPNDLNLWTGFELVYNDFSNDPTNGFSSSTKTTDYYYAVNAALPPGTENNLIEYVNQTDNTLKAKHLSNHLTLPIFNQRPADVATIIDRSLTDNLPPAAEGKFIYQVKFKALNPESGNIEQQTLNQKVVNNNEGVYRLGYNQKSPDAYIIEVETDSNAIGRFSLQRGAKNVLIDWGDGTTEFIENPPFVGANIRQTSIFEHQYTEANTAYEISIDGGLTKPFYSQVPNTGANQLLQVKKFGGVGALSSDWVEAYDGCSRLQINQASDKPDLKGNCGALFRNTDLSLGFPSFYLSGNDKLNLLPVTRFNAFGGSNFNQNINQLDFTNIDQIGGMFARSTFNQPFEPLNFNGTAVSFTFKENTVFNSTIRNLNMANVTNTEQMFKDATSFDQPVDFPSGFTPVTIRNMFNGATDFDYPLDSWNVSNLTDGVALFDNFQSISTVNYDLTLKSWGNQSVKSNVTVDFGNSTYSGNDTAVTSARQNLINQGWTINDGGPV